MPRYFFHRTDGGFEPDTEGSELANHNEARTAAVRYAAESLVDRPDWAWGGEDFRVEVTDEGGLLLFTIICSGSTRQRFGEAEPSRRGRRDRVAQAGKAREG